MGGLYDDEGPTVWPKCPECGAVWVLRYGASFKASDGVSSLRMAWTWQRDCGHKKATPEVVSRDDAEATT